MKNLLYKELRLALHPTSVIFLSLSAMLLIPNYPYYVTFFYTTLGIFFICLSGRENNDIRYSLCLPVRKRDAVISRICAAVVLELVQVLIAVPFALIRNSFTAVPDNQVGMEANIAFFGLSFIMLGIFNLVFFTSYYKAPDKVGVAFIKGSGAVWTFIIAAEALVHIIPFMSERLDTKDPQFLSEKLIVLLCGAVIYASLTLLSARISERSFEKLDF